MSIVLVGSTSGSCTLQEQAVAGTTVLTLPTTSGTILTTASSGQSIPKAALPTGSVLQVVSTTKTDTFTNSSTSFVDITGLSVSITPTSSSSKILVMYSLMSGENASNFPLVRLVRNSTAIAVGDAAGSRAQVSSVAWGSGANNATNMQSMNFLDSPATTSSTTYKLQISGATAGVTNYINRDQRDDDGGYEPRGVSTITVMEIAA
jgi:hypothetical protein